MKSSIENSTPNVSFIVNKTDLPIIKNAFKRISLNAMENILLESQGTIKYLEDTFQNTHTGLIKIELNVQDELPILIRSIKSNSFFNGISITEIIHLQLHTLPELILELPTLYKHQLIAKKIAMH
jgi:hypothetical protein